MKKQVKIAIIVLVLLLELAWLFCPRLYIHGYVFDEPYRNAERKAALYGWVEHRTPETKAAYDAEVKLFDRHKEMILAVGVLINAAGIFLFFRYASAKTPAKTMA